MPKYVTTERDHPDQPQPRCECGKCLSYKADRVSEAFGYTWFEWLCKACGHWHTRR